MGVKRRSIASRRSTRAAPAPPERLQTALFRITQLAHHPGGDHLVRALDCVRAALGLSAAALLEETKAGRPRRLASSGQLPAGGPALPALRRTQPASAAGQVVLHYSGEPAIADPLLSGRPAASAATVELPSNGNARRRLLACLPRPRPFSEAEEQFLSAAAAVIGLMTAQPPGGPAESPAGPRTDKHIEQPEEQRRAVEHALAVRARQQAAVASLSVFALSAPDLQSVMDETVRVLAETLEVEATKILELLPDGKALRLRAGVGWEEGLVGSATVPTGRDSQAGYTLIANGPVVVQDLRTEKRFSGPPLLPEHGVISGMSTVISGMSTVIRGPDGPWGVLGIHSRRRRDFTPDDVNFLQSVASTLSAAIERQWTEQALRDSEARMAAILDTAVDAIITIDEEGVIQSVNPATSRLFGYKPEEMLGQNLRLLMPEPYRSEHHDYIRHYLETGEKRIIGIGREVLGRRKNGEVFPMELAVSEVRLAGRRLFTGMVRDSSERKAQEQRLHELLAQLQVQRGRIGNLVANVPGVVWEAWGPPDEAGQRIDFVSSYAQKMLGYSIEEWLSTPNFWLSIVHPEDRARAAEEAAAIYAGQRPGISEFRWLTKDGRAIWVEAQSTVIRDENGEPIGMRGVTMDISERKFAQQRQHLLAEASAAMASSLDYQKVLQQLAELITESLAEVCWIHTLRPDRLHRAAFSHRDPAKAAGFQRLQPDFVPRFSHDHPVVRVTSTRKSELYSRLPPELVPTAARNQRHLRMLRRLDMRSAMIVPMIGRGKALGTIAVAASSYGRTYNQHDLEFLEELARRAALAIEQAQLYEAEQQARAQAEQTARRIAQLQSLTAALSQALTRPEVAGLVVDHSVAALNADSGVLTLVSDDGAFLEIAAHKGYQKDLIEAWQRVPVTDPNPLAQAATRPRPVITQSDEEFRSQFIMSDRPIAGLQTRIVVPLLFENRAAGLIVLGFKQRRDFTDADNDFLVALARQCAQALERTRLYEAQQLARAEAELSAERTRRLQAVTASLSRALTTEEVAKVVVEGALDSFGLDAGAVLLLASDGKSFELAASRGYTPQLMENWRRFPVNDQTPAGVAAQTGKVLIYSSLEELMTQFPALRSARAVERGMTVLIPMSFESRTAGVISLSSSNPLKFAEQDRELMISVGQIAAQALERARLYEAEQTARAESEAARERQRFLAEASAILFSSLDYETTLTSLSQLCVPYLGDWCIIDIWTPETGTERLAVHHSDPAVRRLAEELRRKYPPDLSRSPILQQAIVKGRTMFFKQIPDEALQRFAEDEEHLRILRSLGLRSAIIVPLSAAGRTLGILTVVTAESQREYSEEDLAFVQELGRRAGLAVENARLYRESQEIQEQLRIANEAKDEFLGMVSHELRTPITTVYGGARLLRARADKLDPESREHVLADIEYESERLHRIVEDLLVLARIELGQEVVTEPILVQRVVGKAVASLQKRRPTRTIDAQLAPDLPPALSSAVYLEQVLRNLLSNADKYSPQGMPVEVSARVEGGNVLISVRDYGAGIPPEEVDLIFERFFRSDRTAKDAGGAGIGLTVCKRLVEIQGGSIWAENAEDGGLCVTFSLPACAG
jgi:PAS domain S-box-containing protein